MTEISPDCLHMEDMNFFVNRKKHLFMLEYIQKVFLLFMKHAIICGIIEIGGRYGRIII